MDAATDSFFKATVVAGFFAGVNRTAYFPQPALQVKSPVAFIHQRRQQIGHCRKRGL
ncbi:hypothetical protein [Pseudomonas fluorescens]|uniref:hypothetical protein n=1 Tax=Pseudomonas fluorescens TaxID=294 RepID=UPI001783011B|nr:hypothetical protein [Pseudomonas fluorescens]